MAWEEGFRAFPDCISLFSYPETLKNGLPQPALVRRPTEHLFGQLMDNYHHPSIGVSEMKMIRWNLYMPVKCSPQA
jgi:hypothetical protein